MEIGSAGLGSEVAQGRGEEIQTRRFRTGGLAWDNLSDLPQLEIGVENSCKMAVKPRDRGQRTKDRWQRAGGNAMLKLYEDLFDELDDIHKQRHPLRRGCTPILP
jgi:hypothetical protein